MLYPLLGKIENNMLLDTLSKETVGINAPRIAVTRTRDERLDVATSELGNTLGFVAVGKGLDVALGRVFRKAQTAGGKAGKWATLARSGAIYSGIFAFMWAMPFIRNYMTTQRTGTTSYATMIGGQQGSNNGQNPSVEESLRKYKSAALKILGLGAAGAAVSTGVGLLATRGKSIWRLGGLNRLLEAEVPYLKEKLVLENGSFNDFGGLKAVLFWGLPAYGGWIQAARDPYEKKEQLLKFVTFVGSFIGPQMVMGKHFEKKADELGLKRLSWQTVTDKTLDTATKEKAIKAWRNKTLGGLGMSILLLGTIPQLTNIYLTRRRMQRAQDNPAPTPMPPAPPAVPTPASTAISPPPTYPLASPAPAANWPELPPPDSLRRVAPGYPPASPFAVNPTGGTAG